MPKVSVKFKSNKAAEEFAANFSMFGDKATVEIKESTAVVSSDDPRAIRFVKQSATDLTEEARCKIMADTLLSKITECISNKKDADVKLMDNSIQKMSLRHAEAFASMYDRLNDENQTAFLVLASENKDSYSHAVNFARANERE